MNGGNFWGSMFGFIAVVGVILVIILMVCREIICWYWKINENIALLTEIRDLLREDRHNLLATRGTSSTSPNVDNPKPVDDEAGSSLEDRRRSRDSGIAKQLAASGYSVEEIAKELQKRRFLSPAEANDLAKSVKSESSGPMGRCPNCENVIPLNSEVCPKCEAQFTGQAVWKIKPL